MLSESEINFIWFDSSKQQEKYDEIKSIKQNVKIYHDLNINLVRFTQTQKFMTFINAKKTEDYNFIIASTDKIQQIIQRNVLNQSYIYSKMIIYGDIILDQKTQNYIYRIVTTLQGLIQQMKEIYFDCRAENKIQKKKINKAIQGIDKISLQQYPHQNEQVQKICVWIDKNMKHNKHLEQKIKRIKKIKTFQNPQQAQYFIGSNSRNVDILIFANNVWDQGYQIFYNSSDIKNFMIYCGNQNVAKQNLSKQNLTTDQIFVTNSQTKLLQKLESVI